MKIIKFSSVVLTAPRNFLTADIFWCKLSQNFQFYYGNWNQLSSCYLSQSVNDFVLEHVSSDVTSCVFHHNQQLVL